MIFFIYDSLGKNMEENKTFSVLFFSFVMYMIFSVLGCFVNIMFTYGIVKYIAHPLATRLTVWLHSTPAIHTPLQEMTHRYRFRL